MLAGISVDYYATLERGNLRGASESVLASIARVLRLDEAEHEHLFDLARRTNNGRAARRRTSTPRVRSSIHRVLNAIEDAPAWVRNARYDVRATNRLAHALLVQLFADPMTPANLARFTLLDPAAKTFWREWDATASDTVAYLRAEAARNPHDRGLSDLIGELATRGQEFRQLWARHDVRFHRTGHKSIHHPIVGDLDLAFEAMEFPSDPGLVLTVYTAEPASASADALRLLASWAANEGNAQTANAASQGK